MANWWVVNKDTKEMIATFDDAGKEKCSIGQDQMWLPVPEGVAPGNAKVVDVEADGDTPATLALGDGAADKVGPLWDVMRKIRNGLLTESDWTQSGDSPLASDVKAAWATYRTTLRDLPENTTNPEDVTWPSKPA